MIDSVSASEKTGADSALSLPERLEKLAQNPSIGRLLGPAAFIYGAGSYLRVLSFSLGLATRSGAAVPVISVGNVTVGGTGKTPFVIDLAARLAASGQKVAILSRGYGRKSKAKTVVASAGAGVIVKVEDCGDEPYMMARAVPSAIVIVGSKRTLSAQLAVEKYGAQIIILDDGFQHVQLKRDLDIVLFDYNDDFDRLALLPQGRLREPLSALGRAAHIVVTKIPSVFGPETKKQLDLISARLKAFAPAAKLDYVRFCPSHLVAAKDGAGLTAELPLSLLKGAKVFAFCGLARPEGFIGFLEQLGATVVDRIIFGDHHWYNDADIQHIKERFTSSGAALVVTSEKDLVRLPLSENLGGQLHALMIKPVWLDANGQEKDNQSFVESLQLLLQVSK